MHNRKGDSHVRDSDASQSESDHKSSEVKRQHEVDLGAEHLKAPCACPNHNGGLGAALAGR